MSYSKFQPLSGGESAIRGKHIGLDGGFRGDVSPREIDLSESPAMDAVRFEGKGIRKDFGFREVGAASSATILALGEHKFISDEQSFRRLIRIFRSGGKGVVEVFDGQKWIEVGRTVEDMQDTFLSTLSIQGRFLFSDGRYIWSWHEDYEQIPTSANFPPEELMRMPGDSSQAVISVPRQVVGTYKVNYSLSLEGASSEGIIVTLGFYLRSGDEEPELLGTRMYKHPASEDPEARTEWEEESFSFRREIDPESAIEIRILDADFGVEIDITERRVILSPSQPLSPTSVVAGPYAPGFEDLYRVRYQIFWGQHQSHQNPTARVIVSVDLNGDGNPTVLDDSSYNKSEHGTGFGKTFVSFNKEFEIEGVNPSTVFWIAFQSFSHSGTDFFLREISFLKGDPDTWIEGLEVRGWNSATDPKPGVEYFILGDPLSILQVLSPDAPGASYMGEFLDRVVAIRDRGETQSLAWNVSGDLEDWRGPGSGQIYLVSGGADPINDLMSFARLGSNIGALFRKRSIARVVPTGNFQQVMGVIEWINGVGTESPFSVQAVRGGVLFLGHDLMVYFLSEGGLAAVGKPIHLHLVRDLTEWLDQVDSTYDPIFGEYFLSTPTGQVWIFDVRRFLAQEGTFWRVREISLTRIATVSKI